MMKKYSIKEIFGPTIQGEGSQAGTVVQFIRFSGCNRWSGREEDRAESQCPFCDTDFYGGDLMTAHDILSKLNPNVEDVVISGGEPLLQLDQELVDTLKDYRIHIETNGSKLPKFDLKSVHHITCSPKQPAWSTILPFCHDLKVLFPYQFQDNLDAYQKKVKHTGAFLQPLYDQGPNLQATIEELYKMKNVRLSLQTHKITGVK
jgi:organic radical activating enzyme